MKEDLPVAARSQGLTIQLWEVRSAEDFDSVFTAMGKQRPDGIYVPAGGLIRSHVRQIAGLALNSRMPSIFNNRESVDAGGLMYYGADLVDSYGRAATYADKILKGAKPADLPVEQPTKFELIVNLNG